MLECEARAREPCNKLSAKTHNYSPRYMVLQHGALIYFKDATMHEIRGVIFHCEMQSTEVKDDHTLEVKVEERIYRFWFLLEMARPWCDMIDEDGDGDLEIGNDETIGGDAAMDMLAQMHAIQETSEAEVGARSCALVL